MENLKELQLLLKNIELIDNKYKILRDADAFNIFTVLRYGRDEVNLHSQFIGHLLDPKESHKKGNEFLKAFLKICRIENFNTDNVKISKEEGKIDLLIKNDSQAIIIENKIDALDQDKQLEKYYDKTPNTIKVIYLTLDGRPPSDSSLGNKKDEIEKILLCLSYENDISNWMDKCIKISALNPPLRETLLQYKKLIGELTGNTMSINERIELRDFLAKGDNALNAQIIVGNWNHVKWHTEWDFWYYFEKIIVKDGFKVLEENKYSEDSLNRFIHNSGRRGSNYGLMIEGGKIENKPFNFMIEKSFEQVGTIIGVTGKFENQNMLENEKYKALKKEVDEFGLLVNYHPIWIGFKQLEPKINFESFSDETTLRLVNKDFREKYINDRWAEIKPFIEACQKALN